MSCQKEMDSPRDFRSFAMPCINGKNQWGKSMGKNNGENQWGKINGESMGKINGKKTMGKIKTKNQWEKWFRAERGRKFSLFVRVRNN